MTKNEHSASMELMHELQKEMNQRLGRIEAGQRVTHDRLDALNHHMAGFHTAIDVHNEEISGLKLRLERVEKRLGLMDNQPEQ